MKFMVSFSGEEPEPAFAKRFAGVGLIRGEYIINIHKKWLTKPEMQSIQHDYILKVAETFKGRDVWYRTIEMPTSWINKLDGCDYFIDEPVDTSLGLRGIRRSLAFPDTFLIELKIIAKIGENHPNLNIILPFIHDVSELRAAKGYLRSTGFKGKVGIMAEIPSTILCLEDFLVEGVDCVMVGLNDLTSFTLAAERSLPIFNNTHPAVVRMMEMVIEKSRRFRVETMVAGKHNPQSIFNAERIGFDAVSVFIPDIPHALKGRNLSYGFEQGDRDMLQEFKKKARIPQCAPEQSRSKRRQQT